MLRENVVEGIRMVEDAYVNWFLVEEGRKCPEPVRRRARQIAPLDEEPKRFGHPFARCVGLHGVPREQERLREVSQDLRGNLVHRVGSDRVPPCDVRFVRVIVRALSASWRLPCWRTRWARRG